MRCICVWIGDCPLSANFLSQSSQQVTRPASKGRYVEGGDTSLVGECAGSFSCLIRRPIFDSYVALSRCMVYLYLHGHQSPSDRRTLPSSHSFTDCGQCPVALVRVLERSREGLSPTPCVLTRQQCFVARPPCAHGLMCMRCTDHIACSSHRGTLWLPESLGQPASSLRRPR